uniref:Type II secretion system protein n=1 Tax=Acidobacterium capsulatum TaxID=33075 RepID=A0A7V4XST5_9BACT
MQRRVSQSAHKPRRPNDPEAGIVLLAAIFLTFLLLLSLAIAAPRLAKSMQRDKEQETIERGRQYEQAIRLYYIKFGHYPTKISELVNTNNLRFLRQKYKDPLTGKDDWKLVLYGQAHVHPLGFFGKPLTAAGAAATNVTALSGGMYAISQDSSIPGAPGSNGNSNSEGDGSTGSGTGSTSFGNSSPMGGGIGGSAISGAGFGSTSTATGSSPLSGSSSSSGFGSSSSSSGGFGNTVPFVGVVPPLKKPSIIAFRKQKNYDRWEFNYDPVEDQAAAAVSILGGGASNLNGSSSNSNSLGNSGGMNSNTPFGGSNSGGNGNGFGNNGFGNSNNNMGFGDSNSNSGSPGSSTDNSNPNPQP